MDGYIAGASHSLPIMLLLCLSALHAMGRIDITETGTDIHTMNHSMFKLDRTYNTEH